MSEQQIAPMGWNSWDCYGAAVTEKEVRQNTDFMAKHLKQYGWEYVVVDIQWYEPGATNHEYRPFADLCMDEYGRLTGFHRQQTGGDLLLSLNMYIL